MFLTARRDREVANYEESGPDVRKIDSTINLRSEMASCAVGHHKQPVHSDRVAQRRPQPEGCKIFRNLTPTLKLPLVSVNLSRTSGPGCEVRRALTALQSRALFRTRRGVAATWTARGLVVRLPWLHCASRATFWIFETVQVCGNPDAFARRWRGRKPSRRRPEGRMESRQRCKECRRFPPRAYTDVHHDRCRPEVAVA